MFIFNFLARQPFLSMYKHDCFFVYLSKDSGSEFLPILIVPFGLFDMMHFRSKLIQIYSKPYMTWNIHSFKVLSCILVEIWNFTNFSRVAKTQKITVFIFPAPLIQRKWLNWRLEPKNSCIFVCIQRKKSFFKSFCPGFIQNGAIIAQLLPSFQEENQLR